MLTITDKRYKRIPGMVTGKYVGNGEIAEVLSLGFVPTHIRILSTTNAVVWEWCRGIKYAIRHDASDMIFSDSIRPYLGKELEANPDWTDGDYAIPYISGYDEAGVAITSLNNGPNVDKEEYHFWAIG